MTRSFATYRHEIARRSRSLMLETDEVGCYRQKLVTGVTCFIGIQGASGSRVRARQDVNIRSEISHPSCIGRCDRPKTFARGSRGPEQHRPLPWSPPQAVTGWTRSTRPTTARQDFWWCRLLSLFALREIIPIGLYVEVLARRRTLRQELRMVRIDSRQVEPFIRKLGTSQCVRRIIHVRPIDGEMLCPHETMDLGNLWSAPDSVVDILANHVSQHFEWLHVETESLKLRPFTDWRPSWTCTAARRIRGVRE
jgi:hypothetical protein